MQIQIQIPEKVNKIIRTLAAAGHEAYAVVMQFWGGNRQTGISPPRLRPWR